MNYGWIVLGIITLIEGLSGFGRTSAFSPFLKDICHDLDLSIRQISGAYALANLLAGLVLPYVGRAYDRSHPSNFLRTYVLLFSGAFIGLSMLNFTGLSSFVNFFLFLVGVSCIRTAVHAYSVAGRSTVAIWFNKKRGLATGLSCCVLSSIASTMPWLNYKLHQSYEWYQVWIVVGLIWVIVSLFLCGFVKKPENFVQPQINADVNVNIQNNFIKKPIFWLIMLSLFFKAFQSTGIAFHLIPIGEELGAKSEAIALSFVFISLINITMTFVFGRFFEKMGVKWILLLFLIFDGSYLFCLKGAASSVLMGCFVVFCGTYWALNQVVIYLVIPKVFGKECIGKIQGYVTAFASLGSTMGPFLIGLIKDFASYQLALSICTVSAFLLLIFGLLIRYKNV